MNAPKTPRRAVPVYTDQERAAYCELAQEVGVNRAIRELGYPTPATGVKWLKQMGVEVNAQDMLKSTRAFHTYYTVEDMLMAIDNAMVVAEEMYLKAETADDVKRLADAYYKIVQTRHLLEGKATSINEKREMSQMDLEILELINGEKQRNAEIEESAENTTQIDGPK